METQAQHGVSVGIRGVLGTPVLERAQPTKCPACGRPFAEGVFGPGTRIMVKCANRRCICHQAETMIVVSDPPQTTGPQTQA